MISLMTSSFVSAFTERYYKNNMEYWVRRTIKEYMDTVQTVGQEPAKEVLSNKDEIEGLKNAFAALETELGTQKQTNNNQQTKISQLTACTAPKVAFTAQFDGGRQLQIRKHETVKFNRMWMMWHDSYDPKTGVFTTQEPGIYMFNVNSVSGNRFNDPLVLVLMKRSAETGTSYIVQWLILKGENQEASANPMVQLDVGDTVWVMSDGDGKLHTLFLSFSGALLRSANC